MLEIDFAWEYNANLMYEVFSSFSYAWHVRLTRILQWQIRLRINNLTTSKHQSYFIDAQLWTNLRHELLHCYPRLRKVNFVNYTLIACNDICIHSCFMISGMRCWFCRESSKSRKAQGLRHWTLSCGSGAEGSRYPVRDLWNYCIHEHW